MSFRGTALATWLSLWVLFGGSVAAQEIRSGPRESLSADNPRAERAAELINPILSGNTGAAESYLRKHAVPSALDQSLSQLWTLAGQFGSASASIRSFVGGTGADVMVLLNGSNLVIMLELEESEPYRITGIRTGERSTGAAITPAAPPQQAISPAPSALQDPSPAGAFAPVAVPPGGTSVPATDPFYRRAEAFLQGINSGTAEDAAAVRREHLTSGLTADFPVEEVVERFSVVRNHLQGAAEISGVWRIAEDRIHVNLVNPASGREAVLELTVEKGPDPRVGGILFRRVRPSLPPSATAAPREVVLATPVVSVPLHFLNHRIAVEVMINGKGPFLFMLETGSSTSMIWSDLAKQLELPISGEHSSTTVQSLRLGGATLREMTFLVQDGSLDDAVHGLLGLNAFTDVLLTLDYPAKLVRLEKGGLPAPNGQDILPISRTEGSVWAFPVTVAGESVQGVLDTQADGGLFAATGVGERIPYENGLVVTGMASGPTIGEVQRRTGRVAGEARIGHYVLPNPVLEVVPYPPHMSERFLVGGRVLKNFVVTLDQKNSAVRFARPAGGTTLPTDPPVVSLGFQVIMQNGGARVGDVRPESPAGRAGIERGDEVVALAGVQGPELTPGRVAQVAREGRPFTVQILRAGKLKTFTMELWTPIR